MCRELHVGLRALGFVLYLVLAFCGGVCVMSLLAKPAHGLERKPPKMTCAPSLRKKVRCEMQNIEPVEPYWEVSERGKVIQRSQGPVTYLDLSTSEFREVLVYYMSKFEKVTIMRVRMKLVRQKNGFYHFLYDVLEGVKE